MTYAEKATQLHESGENCAQAVLGSCCERFDMDPETASRLTAFFGGGMRHGEVCGARSGALMALGLEYGDENNRKCPKSVLMLKAFQDEFGSVRCRDLVGEDGKGKKALCPVLIKWVAQYLEEDLK
jgi:C_GCAxxG_C_C family probable redox protein